MMRNQMKYYITGFLNVIYRRYVRGFLFTPFSTPHPTNSNELRALLRVQSLWLNFVQVKLNVNNIFNVILHRDIYRKLGISFWRSN